MVYTALRMAKLIAVATLLVVQAGCIWSLPWRSRSEKLVRLGVALAGCCERLGPTYIKLGQLLSTRADLIPREALVGLVALQDRVRPLSRRRFRLWFRELFGRHPGIFAEISRDPIAAGSVSEVYKARLDGSGEWLAVKIQRPGLARMVDADFRILRTGARLIQRLAKFNNLPIGPVLDQIWQSTVQQMDFVREQQANADFHRLFLNHPKIQFPKIIAELSGTHVITMEYLPCMQRLDDIAIDDARFRRAADLLLHTVYSMIFVGGLVHCDLHPANVYLGPTGSLCVLDTGFTVRLSANDRNTFARFFRALAFNQGEICARILVDTAVYRGSGFNPARFTDEIKRVVARASGAKARDFSVVQFAYALFDCQRRHGLLGSPNFIMPIWALLMVEGLVRNRLPELDFQSKAVPYLVGSLINAVPA